MTKHCHRRQGESLFTSTSPRGRFAAVFVVLLLLPLGLGAQGAQAPQGPQERHWTVRAAGPGRRAVAPDLKSPAELVTLEAGLTPRLLALAPEASLEVADWPVAPEVRNDVVLTRHEVYSPESKILRVDGKKLTEVPRSRLAFYWGTAKDDDQVRVFLSLDPATGAMQSFTQSREGIHELRPAPGRTGKTLTHMVAPAEAFVPGAATGEAPSWECGEQEAAQNPRHLTGKALSSIFASASAPFTDLHSVTMGIDTDNELMLQKFNNDTTAAASYIASLFAAMNVMYERDLHVRLLQGTTFLRVSTTADPYNQSGTGNADGNKLDEFGTYWQTNYTNVSRGLAMMLSGKQGSTNSASGIAWISGLCSPFYGYSFSQVFKISYLAGDALVVGHEIGHNFGSPHTHCYSPPADNCYNAEAGCYSGGTSCPAPQTINGVTGVAGTIMSYCHLLGSCTSSMVFHPRSLTEYINAALAGANNVCVLPVNTSPTVSGVTPKSGTTAGGTAVAIPGTNFQAGATVTIGGVAALGVAVVGNTITATTGAHATGPVAVAVTNPGNSSGSLSNAFFYDAPSGALHYYTVTPCRLVDTRNPNGPLGGPALGAGTQRTFTVAGHCGVPAGAKSLAANVTVTGQAAGGFLGFYAGNAIPLGTSTINFGASATRTNNAVLELATDGSGTIGVQNGAAGSVQLILDVVGYFQ
jgi:hypothetical protein